MIQRRDQQEHIVSLLAVMILFAGCGMHERTVLVKYGLGKSRRTRRKINGRLIVIRDRNIGSGAGAVCHGFLVVIRKCRAVVSNIYKKSFLRKLVTYLLNTPYELRAEHKHIYL